MKKSQNPMKMVAGIFIIALRLRDRHVLMWQSQEILNIFDTLTLKQVLWRIKTIFKNLVYRCLVESSVIESVTFSYKTVLLKVKTNWMVSTKSTYHKERSFATILFFWNFNLNIRTSFDTNDSNIHINIFCKRLSFIWGCVFSVSILKLQWLS